MNGDSGPPGPKVSLPSFNKQPKRKLLAFAVSQIITWYCGEYLSQGLPGKTGAPGLQGPVGKSVSINHICAMVH